MKKLIFLLILICLPISPVWADDTTKAYCGECVSGCRNDSVFLDSRIISAENCEKLPISCWWECIEGDLYRICKTEDREEGDKITAIMKYRYYSQYDTIQICDTLVFKKEQALNGDIWTYYEVYCRDTVVKSNDNTD